MDQAPETNEISIETNQKKNPIRDILNRLMPRRKLIRDAATLTAATAVGAKVGREVSPSDDEVKADFIKNNPLPATETPIASKPHEAKLVTVASVKKKLPEVLVDKEHPERFLISHYTGLEREALEKRVKDQSDRLKDEVDLENSLKNSKSYENLIEEVMNKNDFSQSFRESEIPKLLPGLIFSESRGNNKTPPSDSGAQGLCQIMPQTETDIREMLGLKEGDYNLLDPETNIRFALTYLDLLYNKYFPEEGTAIWAYHLGQGEMAVVVGKMFGKNIGPTVGERQEYLNKCSKIFKDNYLNFESIIDSEFVQGNIIGNKAFDKTWIYFPETLAASRRMAA